MIYFDGVAYDCETNYGRTVTMTDLYNVTTKDYVTHRKIANIKRHMTITFGNKNNGDYESLRAALCAFQDYHTLEWYDGNQWREIECSIYSVADTYFMDEDGNPIYDNMEIYFEDRNGVTS